MAILFHHTMQDNLGNLLFDVSGTMRLAGTGTLATIYGDEALTVILPNPMTNHPSFGSFKCFLPVGDYDFYMAKAGYTFETLTGIQGLGTMAQQDAHAVAITGGTATLTGLTATGMSSTGNTAVGGTLSVTGTSQLGGVVGIGTAPDALYSLSTVGGVKTGGRLIVSTPLGANNQMSMTWNRNVQDGITMQSVSDAGAFSTLAFLNAAGGQIGSITQTGTATSYNTTSDSRLKKLVETLTGELDTIQALRPVRFRWLADDSPGVGFLASEVAAHVAGVITGEPDEVHPDGTIKPQMIDYSKLVPFLVGAVQTLAARVAVMEDALGI